VSDPNAKDIEEEKEGEEESGEQDDWN